ncbi:ABC transporter ATP-binding protein [Fundicoccus sp. Sow4_F4]|uniref:ABC transporter ATP-binding protein n=1 Tax=Fundicoccus sp. Sow4_F4 TaxID=3438783 RepID=UPI003F90FA9A
MNNFSWAWTYVKTDWGKMLVACLLLLVNSGLFLVNPYLIGLIVDQVIYSNQGQLLIPIILTMVGSTLIRTVVRYSYQMMFEQISQNSLYRLRQDLYHKVNELDFEYFNHTRVGDVMARMTGDTDAIRHFIGWVSYNIVESLVWFVCAIVAMGLINVPLTLSLVAVTPFIFIFARRLVKKSSIKFFDIRESFSRLNSMVEENIGGNRMVKAFAQEEFEIEKFDKHNDDFKQKNLASADVTRTYMPWLEGFAGSLNVITLVLGGYLVIQESVSMGELVAFNSYLWMLNNPMRMSGWLLNDVQRFQAACIKIRDLLTTQSRIPVINHDGFSPVKGQVEFAGVSFKFADDPNFAVLNNVSFKAEVGQTVGIIGETGSGKSTLVNLIGRFYDATEGEVKIDGHNIKEYPVRFLRNHISMVMQDVFLFSNTISDNIAFGDPYTSASNVKRMAAVADADAFISRMPDGYSTIVGERGVGLSGGQKQRISLARALTKVPSILILDDTTSAVDMETEAKIQQGLNEVTDLTTTFIIAHRISSVRDADLILMLDKGSIVERGTHSQLIAQRGRYYRLYQKQLGMEIADDDQEAVSELTETPSL